MSARYWHDKDHMMPFRPDGKDPETGITYHGDVLTGRKSVGQALWEAGLGRPQERIMAPTAGITGQGPDPRPEEPAPEAKGPKVYTGSPAQIARAILRDVERRRGR